MFKINRRGSDWGANLVNSVESPIRSQLDLYYLGFIAGVGLGDAQVYQASDVKDLVENYTAELKPYRYVLAGVLLVSDLKSGGFTMEKKIVSKRLAELIDGTDPTCLSDDSIQKMNRYSYAGLEYLMAKMKAAPDAVNFLLYFHNNLIPELFANQ